MIPFHYPYPQSNVIHRNHTVANIPQPVQTVVVAEEDVLMGRTSKANSHPGNQRFRELIRRHRTSYQDTQSRDQKVAAVQAVMSAVQSAGGRFLREDGRQWVEISHNRAHEKVGHALRSSRPVGYKSQIVSRKLREAKAKNICIPMSKITEKEDSHKNNTLTTATTMLPTVTSVPSTIQSMGSMTRCVSGGPTPMGTTAYAAVIPPPPLVSVTFSSVVRMPTAASLFPRYVSSEIAPPVCPSSSNILSGEDIEPISLHSLEDEEVEPVRVPSSSFNMEPLAFDALEPNVLSDNGMMGLLRDSLLD